MGSAYKTGMIAHYSTHGGDAYPIGATPIYTGMTRAFA